MVNIWHDLSEFSGTAHIATQTGRELEPDLLLEVIISIQYQLLNLTYDNKDAHKLLRVVMLAYTISILPLLLPQFGALPHLSYPSLYNSLQWPLITPEQLSNEKLKALYWILVIIGISVLGDTPINLQLVRAIRALKLSSWDEILEILNGFR